MKHIEHYRKLATALHQAQRQRGVKIVMVASAAPGEGKSLTAANLARMLSGSYRRRVLLVDADLRRPVLHLVNNVENECGLDDMLESGAPLVELQTISLSDTLDLLTAGRPNPDPIAALTSPRMRELLTFAASIYDWVLVDTPPVALLPDSELLGCMVDAALLVVASGETDYRLVTKAVAALGRERILGVVLNKVDESELPSKYDTYEYSDSSRQATR
jgi:protein-tyrosine kinase